MEHGELFRDLTPQEAVQKQKELRHLVRIEPFRGKIRWIGGADVSFDRFSPTVYAGIVILDAESMQVLDSSSAVMKVKFPYIPGLLSFREIPPLLKAWDGLKMHPDILMMDGQGIAHPRRFGIASHFGVLTDTPTLGCAKKLLTGQYDEPDNEEGSISPLRDRSDREQIGLVVRTKTGVKPVFVSPGHRTDIETSLHVLQLSVRRHRIPEPTRQAHLFVKQIRQIAKHSSLALDI